MIFYRIARKIALVLGFELNRIGPIDWQRTEKNPYSYEDLPEDLMANLALVTVVKHFSFTTVLDIGAGSGAHSEYFKKHGKTVTSLDTLKNSTGIMNRSALD